MKIVFKDIFIKDFMSFKEASVDLSKQGYTLVQGFNNCAEDNAVSNGSGKSSIFEAIVWSLTGETIRGHKMVERMGGAETTSVQISFSVDGDEYVVKRTKNPSNLFLYKNEENLSGKGIKDTQKILEQTLPDITASLIGSVIILGQGLPQRFSNNTPVGRKEVLEKLSKSDFMIEDIKHKIDDRKNFLSDNLIRLNTEIATNQSELKFYDDKLNDSKTKLESLITSYNSNIDEKIKEYENKISILKNNIKDNDENLINLRNQLSEQNILKTSLRQTFDTTIKNIKDKYQPQIEDKTEKKNEIEREWYSLKNEIKKLKSITDICPTCGQKMPNIEKPDTTQKEKELEVLYNKLEEIKQEISELNKQLKQETDKSSEEENKAYESIDKKIKEINSEIINLENSNRVCNNNIQEYTTNKNNIILLKEKFNFEKDSLEKQIKEYDKNIKEIKEDLLDLTNNVLPELTSRIDLITKINNLVNRDFRGYLLLNIIEYLNATMKDYSKFIFGHDNITMRLDGNNINIEFNNKDYSALSGGEKQKIDIIVQFALRHMLCRYLNFSSNILVLDEITDNLDSFGAENIINFITNKLNDVDGIYLISHHEDFQIPCDNRINVIKNTDNISIVEQC